MYKVMLLDDEPWELKGMKNMLPWGKYGFEVVSVLSNPLKALELLKAESFDVLVSDIRMPGLDGISLLKEIRSFDSNLEIIFVSGYAEFEYAREALRSGAYDYLLKPVDLDATDSLLSRLKSRLDEKKQDYMLRLMDKISGEKISLKELFPQIDESFSCYAVMGGSSLASFLESCQEELPQHSSFWQLSLPYGQDCCLCFLACKDTFSPDAFLGERLPRQMLGCSLSLSGSELMALDGPSRLAMQAFTAYHSSFFLQPPGLYLYKETDGNALRDVSEQIHSLYMDKKTDELRSYLNQLPHTLQSISINVNGMVRLWNQLMLLLSDADLYEESCLLSAEHMLDRYSDIEKLTQELIVLLENQTVSCPEQSAEEGKHIYSAMIRYVNEHFTEPITLQDVADCVHVNFTYASKLFKKYTKTNYSKYLTELRMNLACRLLSNTDKTTEEICYEIGYKDYFYFNKTFKKHIGQTPLQYRRK